MPRRAKHSLAFTILSFLLTAAALVVWQQLKTVSQPFLTEVLTSPVPTLTPQPSPTVAGTQSADLQVSSSSAELVPVIKVVDGDTISVELTGKKTTIRLIGVDTPEVVDPRKPVQCFGQEASAYTKSALTNQSVKLVSDPTQGDKDKYGRLLRYVFLADGTLFNQQLIAEGYAHEYTYDIPYQYQLQFKAAQKTARENKKGLWADNVCF